jgi:hypothetical protein
MSERELDWTKLPSHLRYLAGPVEKYGKYQFEIRICDYLEQEMTEAEKYELVRLGARMSKDSEAIERWLDEYNMAEHEESGLVYFTMCLLAHGHDLGVFG